MLRKIRILQHLFAIAFLAGCATTDSPLPEIPKAEQPSQATSPNYSIQQIEKMVADAAPVLNTADANINGFRIRIGINKNGSLYNIECAYDGSKKEKCVVYDGYDNVPIVIAANNQVLFYEPSGGIYLSNHSGWSISIGPSDDGIKLGWGLHRKVNESRISVDLRPLVQPGFVDQIVERIDRNRYRYLARTKAGNRVEVIIDARKKQYERLSSWIQGEEFIVLEVLTGDQPIAASSFGFPLIPDQIETKPINFPDFDDTQLSLQAKGIEELVGLAYRFLNIREAIRDPAKRKKIEDYLGEEFDWAALKSSDNRISSWLLSLRDDFVSRFANVINRYASSEKSVFGRHAKKGFKQYLADDNYKAFAQSASGAWGAYTGAYSTFNAVKEALKLCVKYNEAESRFPCKIINLNNRWASEL